MFCIMKWEVATKHFCCQLKCWSYLRKSTYMMFAVGPELSPLFIEDHLFSLEV